MIRFKIMAVLDVAIAAFGCWIYGFPAGFALIGIVAAGLYACWRMEKVLNRQWAISI